MVTKIKINNNKQVHPGFALWPRVKFQKLLTNQTFNKTDSDEVLLISEKEYEDPAEDARRKQNYKESRDRINAHNELYEKGLSSFGMGINQFSDLVRLRTKCQAFLFCQILEIYSKWSAFLHNLPIASHFKINTSLPS